jgi:geranylgeranyl diphosphate synthase type I
VSLEDVTAKVLCLPEVSAWPKLADFFKRSVSRVKWDFPLLACQAVGGEPAAGVSGAAAIACIQLSLVLVDDMLDQDPRGVHLQVGEGVAANLAFALQAAAFHVIEQAPVSVEQRVAVYASLARMALTSAFGQDLDAQSLSSEEDYWRVVQTKSATCFGSALYIGALLGQESTGVAERLYDLGFLVGENIQIYDDLLDALKSPASPDWKQGRTNLAILYALAADHPERAQLETLRTRVDDSQALEAAQQILIRCGAISYCVYHIIKRYQAAEQLLNSIPLVDPEPLRELVVGQSEPLVSLLESIGSVIPPELGML